MSTVRNSRSIHVRLRRLFPGRNLTGEAQLARVCVLYEDLHLETRCLCLQPESAKNRGSDFALTEIDRHSSLVREMYFLRRLVCTLSEFSDALRELNRDQDIQRVLASEDQSSQREWNEAVKYFNDDINRHWLRGLRNDIGGHFGQKAARKAVEGLLDAATGRYEEYETSNRRYSRSLKFASEIQATVLFSHAQGKTPEERIEWLTKHILTTSEHAINIATIVIEKIILPRL